MNENESKSQERFSSTQNGYNTRVHEHVSEPMRKHAHGRLPRAYPALPGFGILYLSVPRAATLIVRDIYERHRKPFDTLPVDVPEFARKIAKLQEDLNAMIQKHLLKAIEKGRLRSINVSNTYQEFINHGDQSDESRSHIFYGDLINWLINSGYEDGRFLAVGPAFEEYERQELDLGKQVELFIQRRRGQNGADSNDAIARTVDVGDGYVDYLEDALHRSADIVSELKQKLGLAPIVQEAGPLHPKERESLLALVAALLKLREKKGDDTDLVGKIALATKQNRKSLSEGTVRKYLVEAGSLHIVRKTNKAQLPDKNSIEINAV